MALTLPHPAPLDSDPLIRTDFTDDGARQRICAAGHLPGPWNPKRKLYGPHAVQFVIVDHRMYDWVSPGDLANMAEVPDLLECAAVSSDSPTGAASYRR